MTLRVLVSILACHLAATGSPAQELPPGMAHVLVVAQVDQPNRRVLFETTGYEEVKVEKGGKVLVAKVPVRLMVAFRLEEGKAITADGKAVKDADLFKRVKAGKPVVLLTVDPASSGEELYLSIRALFKDDTILLVGATKPVLKEKGSPKKP